ncbi:MULTISPECIES: RNA-binding S4 domain-containing protein [Mammaliicoccus]|uniref:RQC P-site tRNA stabilizing factor n=1 Tax=Mammaliicoccus lentus TaxID=42858 RepID=A0AAX3W591_MAMLE|nr:MULTISPECIES: RNA-binding S4 domain-containing protein [Mammaliicoccus]HBV03345.1 RNA-binding S4 domain-containing protein [Staphylococcus sp.]MBF0750238.1 RNA-binding S4 domain-containing protein [Mammaliicoccus lentus]MBF0795697.1 RNA-binding S4 domain-containing protein [Mammaliicoccus lentus]MBU6114524.1 RNA-binding S4 domain-containing protein [Mammaliicoccus lentus]MBW0763574.1 RNA-binding S4 domain-containing protein [Mammaliicoccus lentus]
MRLDKYLKVSRLIKRRTLAKEVSDQGRVKINGQTAKAGTNVNVDDELELKLGNRIIVVKVTGLSEHANKENAKTMFEVVKEEKIQDSI